MNLHSLRNMVFSSLYLARGKALLSLVIFFFLWVYFLEVFLRGSDMSSLLYLTVWLWAIGAGFFVVELLFWVLLLFYLCTCCARAAVVFYFTFSCFFSQLCRKNCSWFHGVHFLSLFGGHLHLILEFLIGISEIWRRPSLIIFVCVWWFFCLFLSFFVSCDSPLLIF